MGNLIDIKGERFGKWIVLYRTKSIKNKAAWICKCDCGTEKSVIGSSLYWNLTKSCGCSKKRPKINIRIKRLKYIYFDMIYRCTKEYHKAYKNYGERGIKVCNRWLESFDNFFTDMGLPEDGLLLDRQDNNGNYCKENCKWVTRKEQNNNRRMCIFLDYKGERLNLKQIWEKYSPKILTYSAFIKRYNKLKNIDKILGI